MHKSIFTGVQTDRMNSNVFDLSHDRKFSGKMGNLIPILNMDVLPGDKISVKSNVFLRFAPMIAPVMHRVSVYVHYFFVPNRIIWDNWEDFISGGEDGLADPVWPYLEHDLTSASEGSLFDYMGLPVGADGGLLISQFSALPFAAYNMIFNEIYRDQNLIPKVTDQLTDGENAQVGELTSLKKRAWQHDYFTSALPFTQKGPEAMLPLGGTAPILAFDDPNDFPNATIQQKMKFSLTGADVPPNVTPENITYQEGVPITRGTIGAGAADLRYIDLDGTHYTDLSGATAASIIDLRRAEALQIWLEKNARGGSRYTEFLKVHFNINAQDSRLQRPEYFGGFAAPMKISEVLQTTPSDIVAGVTPQGNMAGHGVSMGSGGYASFTVPEHGYIMGIMSVMPQSAYQQGIPRHLNRQDKYDYFFKEFQHIGEEPILNNELYNNHTDPQGVFGYKPRYADYKYIPSTVHGDFRTTLDFWHMGRKFSTSPALNRDFIEMDFTEVDRIFAVQDDSDHLWCHVLNEIKAKRPMAYYGNPHS